MCALPRTKLKQCVMLTIGRERLTDELKVTGFLAVSITIDYYLRKMALISEKIHVTCFDSLSVLFHKFFVRKLLGLRHGGFVIESASVNVSERALSD